MPWFIAPLIESIFRGWNKWNERPEPADYHRRFMNRDCHIKTFSSMKTRSLYNVITLEKTKENACEA